MQVLRTLVALLCLAPASTLLAQYTAGKINFKNPGPYAQADLEAASGLQVGKAFNKEGLTAAAQKLISSGLFEDVQVVLDGPVHTISVNFTLKPYAQDQLLQARFVNLVWWQPQELRDGIHAHVPLFGPATTAVAEAGDEQDSVQTAIEQMLAAKGITARLTHTVVEPSLADPHRTVVYQVADPSVRLHSFTISGASSQGEPALKKRVAALIGKPYLEETPGLGTVDYVLNLYRNTGYLAASLTDVHRAIATAATSGVDVDLTGTLHEGDLYHVGAIDWPESALLSPADLTRTAKLKPGDVASGIALLQSLLPLDRAYRAKGYLDVIINTTPALDGATHLVGYNITVSPGEPYRIKSISVENLTPAQTAEFNSAWKLKPEDVYDTEYIKNFLTGNGGLNSLRGYSASYTVAADPTTHHADLTLTFVKGGHLVQN